MSPIVSTLAGVAARGYGGLGASVGVAFAPSGAYDSIATTTLSTATATISFTSIPATYTHLQVRMLAKDSTNSTGATNIEMRFNSDSAGNYTRHYLRGTGTAADAGSSTSQSQLTVGTALQNGAGIASMFGVTIVDILDYANTNKYKTVKGLSGQDTNSSGTVWLQSGVWMNTAAITRIDLTCGGTNFVQYSSFALYGIKGA